MSLNNIYVRALAPRDLLEHGASATTWDAIDFAKENRANRKGEAAWRLKMPAVVYGFATWWRAELTPGVMLSTAPGEPATHWEQLYFPLLEPIEGKAGDTVAISVRSRSSLESGTHVAWTATRADGKGRQLARQALNLDKGFLP